MSRKRYSPEEIVHKLREAYVLLGQAETAGSVIRQLGVSRHRAFRPDEPGI